MTNKDLILQYVDTGLKLPKYQVERLPSWAIKTYIRKREIAARQSDDVEHALSGYEYLVAPPEVLQKKIDSITDSIYDFGDQDPNFDFQYGNCPDGLRYMFIDDRQTRPNDRMVKAFLSNPRLLSKINKDIIEQLLKRSENPEIVHQMIGDELWQKFISMLSERDLKEFIVYSPHPMKMVQVLGEKGLQKLEPPEDENDVLHTQVTPSWIAYSKNPIELAQMLGDRATEWIKSLTYNQLMNCINNGGNRSALRKLFMAHGVDWDSAERDRYSGRPRKNDE